MRVFAAVLCLLAALAAPARAQGAFVAGIEDLPLMPGLTAQGEASVFDAPQGRIVEASAQGAASRAAILEFYARTLPQLGWRGDGDGRFAREGERLVLEFPASQGATLVRFFLRPE
ncbi:MAG: hypothetical protein ACKOEE_03615 [Tagaea sp.]|jgi:hypothetical protein|nr:hypothetical protein [Azospirillum sp.]MCA3266101.1 hypothetical protein [Azospirillum sp.]